MLTPLLFEPNLHPTVWGGKQIQKYKNLTLTDEPIGESWEVSVVPSSVSIISNGAFKGMPLDKVVKEYGAELLGKEVFEKYNGQFPLLIKFIDAAADLSIQVHPNDELASEVGKNGKTECWYIIDAKPGAYLYAGMKEKISKEEYVKRVEEGTICDVLAKHDVKTGDVFYLPAGRVHAICNGILLAEVHQSSDVTYRIYDYNRPGLDGKPRELHTELAKDAIDYTVCPDHRTHYILNPDGETEVVKCKYFETSVIDIRTPFIKDLSELDSFVVLVCIEGNGVLYDAEILNDGPSKGHTISISRGETILIPASSTGIRIVPKEGMKIVASWIP